MEAENQDFPRQQCPVPWPARCALGDVAVPLRGRDSAGCRFPPTRSTALLLQAREVAVRESSPPEHAAEFSLPVRAASDRNRGTQLSKEPDGGVHVDPVLSEPQKYRGTWPRMSGPAGRNRAHLE